MKLKQHLYAVLQITECLIKAYVVKSATGLFQQAKRGTRRSKTFAKFTSAIPKLDHLQVRSFS